MNDDVTGRVVVYFRGLQNHTVDTKSTRRDVIIERIRSFCLSLETNEECLKNPSRVGGGADCGGGAEEGAEGGLSPQVVQQLVQAVTLVGRDLVPAASQ